jgi:hypothetical protein
MFPNHQVGFSIAQDTDRATAFDTFRGTLGVLGTRRVVIDIAHHVDDLACYLFGGCAFAMFGIGGESKRGSCQSGGKGSRHCYFY